MNKSYHLSEFSPRLVIASDGEVALFGKGVNLVMNGPHWDGIHMFTRNTSGKWSAHSWVVSDDQLGKAYQLFGAEQVRSTSPRYAVLASEREVGEDRELKQYMDLPTPTPFTVATISDTVGAAMDVDDSNRLHVVYVDTGNDEILYRRRSALGSWTEEETAVDLTSSHEILDVHVYWGDESEDLHIAYLEKSDEGTYTIRHVLGDL